LWCNGVIYTEVACKCMKFIFAFFTILFFAAPVWAVDITMGSGFNLIFDPNEVTIDAGDTIKFINGELPPHNMMVEGHPELSHGDLAFSVGDSFEVTFPDAGDYNFQCDPHAGAGMKGTIHVN